MTIPVLVTFPVVVVNPDPTVSVPLFCSVDRKRMLPVVDSSNPVEVTAPVKVSVPAVETTEAVPPIVEAPVTARSRVAELMTPALPVVNIPATVALLVTRVAVPAVLIEVRLLKEEPVIL